jgi:hypothetical protein
MGIKIPGTQIEVPTWGLLAAAGVGVAALLFSKKTNTATTAGLDASTMAGYADSIRSDLMAWLQAQMGTPSMGGPGVTPVNPPVAPPDGSDITLPFNPGGGSGLTPPAQPGPPSTPPEELPTITMGGITGLGAAPITASLSRVFSTGHPAAGVSMDKAHNKI